MRAVDTDYRCADRLVGKPAVNSICKNCSPTQIDDVQSFRPNEILEVSAGLFIGVATGTICRHTD